MTSPVGLGFRALRGGAVTVGVTIEAGQPRVVLSTFLATAADGDRLALAPYAVAAGMARGADGKASAAAAATIAEGRRRQEQLAASGLSDIIAKLREVGHAPVVAALLINRAGWITDLLEYSLFAPEHPAVAEGLAVRDALRFAFGQVGLEAVEDDETSLPERASEVFGLSPVGLDLRLKDLGAPVGRPWRKEQKLACLAAWFTLAAAR
jgi:hypothetical protein